MKPDRVVVGIGGEKSKGANHSTLYSHDAKQF